jgi:hypothetical protein
MSTPRILSVLPLAVLAACAGPAERQEMTAAQTALFGEAMAYWRCMESNQDLPERCRVERWVYEDELTAFKATYGAADKAH